MKRRSILLLFLILLNAMLLALPVYSEETATTGSKDLKFTAGADIRLRQEIWPNTVFLGSLKANGTSYQYDRNFFRLRLSVWGKAELGEHFDAFARITTEPRYYLGPYHPTMTGPGTSTVRQYTDQDEVIVDNLYVSGKKLFDGLVDMRLGRQDFLAPEDIYGEGFLLIDGTPGDGSRTFYFNAAKARLNITKQNSIDFLYINDPETDRFMPSLHPEVTGNSLYSGGKRLLNSSSEQAAVIYSRNKIGKMFTFDPYYIYKIEDGFGINPRLNLNTFGGRVTFNSEGWRAKAELAYQFGEYDSSSAYPQGIDRTGLGGYGFVGYKFNNTPGKPEFDLGAVYYSGDDPNDPSNKRKAFDPLFSRSPYWNELYVYTLVPETAAKYSNGIPGYWTNMIIYMAKGKVELTKTTALTMSYQYLMSAEKTSGLDPLRYSNDSRDRGHLGTAVLSHQIMKNLTGMLQFEYFAPGNFYTSNTKDAIFFRWELRYRI
jgi:hypothetical protein